MKSKYSGILFLAAAFGAYAADWLTFGGNPQRDGWAKHETILTKDGLKDFGLQWKLHLDNEPKELSSLTAPLVVENVYTSRGVKDILVIAGSSDNLYAIDADSGKVFWQKKFTVEGKPKQQPHWLCPGGLNDTPTIAEDPGGNFATKRRGDDIWVARPGLGPHSPAASVERFGSLTDCDAEPTSGWRPFGRDFRRSP